MGFHRTVMRNHARRVARSNGLGMTATWDGVRALPWRAHGCLAVVETCKHKRTLKQGRRSGVRHAAPKMAPIMGRNPVENFLLKMANTASIMALMQSERGR